MLLGFAYTNQFLYLYTLSVFGFGSDESCSIPWSLILESGISQSSGSEKLVFDMAVPHISHI